MAIEGSDDDGYELRCDSCGEAAEEQFDEFMEAVAFKKERSNGWRSRKRGGSWEDLCPDCSDAYIDY